MKGILLEGFLPSLLRQLYVGRRTGLLHVDSAEGLPPGSAPRRRSLRFHHGNIEHAQSERPEEQLGARLMRDGLISELDLERATELVRAEQLQLGQVLIEMGAIEKDQLEQVIAAHAGEAMSQFLSARNAAFEFEETEPDSVRPPVTIAATSGDLILRAVGLIEDRHALRAALGDLDRVVQPATDPLLRFQPVALKPLQGYLLSRIDGTLTAREVLALSPGSEDDTERSLYGLLCAGLIDYVEPGDEPARPARPAAARAVPPPRTPPPTPVPAPTAPRPTAAPMAPPPPAPAAPPPPAPAPLPVAAAPPAPAAVPVAPPAPPVDPGRVRQDVLETYEAMRTRNHFEMLGITPEAKPSEVKQAYQRLARRYHPDVHHGPATEDLHDKLTAIFVRLGQANAALSDPDRRTDYERKLGIRRNAGGLIPPPGPGPSTPGTGTAAAPSAPAPPPPPAAAPDAGVWLARAEQLMSKEQYWDAIQLLEEAVELARGPVLQRVRMALALCYSKNPKWVRRAEEVLRAVVATDPRHFEGHLMLGRMYRDLNLKKRAATMLRKAVELRPDHTGAREDLDKLEPPPEVPEES